METVIIGEMMMKFLFHSFCYIIGAFFCVMVLRRIFFFTMEMFNFKPFLKEKSVWDEAVVNKSKFKNL